MVAIAALTLAGAGAYLVLFADAASEDRRAALAEPSPDPGPAARRAHKDRTPRAASDGRSIRVALALPGSEHRATGATGRGDAAERPPRVADIGRPATPRASLAAPRPGAEGRNESGATTDVKAASPPAADAATAGLAPVQRMPDEEAEKRTRQMLALPTHVSVPAATVADDQAGDLLELVIARGDTLDGLFKVHGISRADLARILRIDDAAEHLRLLRPGDRIAVRHADGALLTLQRAIDEERSLSVRREGDGFAGRVLINPVERRRAYAHGVIESSLFRAAQRAGISDTLIMELAGVFAWDIDFVLDIRRGDSFTVLYEEIWQDGEKLRDGEILAAEFVNDDDVFRAVRFVTPEGDSGYYTPEGLNVKKAFLRAPIAITPRVTSNFNPRRLHPVHKRVRPHRGVDYGAPSGTPIKAAGDGKVIFRGRKGGYGNAVILQHGGNITTLYAHMSRFHKRARVGQRVKQGQIIGYVGATGTVTGAHLHYEYRVNGVHRNPRTVKLPQAEPVARQHRDAFMASSAPLLERLEVVSRSWRLARASQE